MAHRSSAPAIHNARVLLKFFTFIPKPGQPVPGLLGTDAHLSIVIDHASNAHILAEQLPRVNHMIRRLRTSVVSAGEIATFFKDLIEKFEAIPQHTKDEESFLVSTVLPSEAYFGTVTRPVSKVSIEIARWLYFYYDIVPISGTANKEVDFKEVARYTEATIGIPRAMEVLPELRKTFEDLRQGQATERQVRLCLREAGVKLAHLPCWETTEEVTKLLI
jgi:hypothetical protein